MHNLRHDFGRAAAILCAVACVFALRADAQQLDVARYFRADRLLGWNLEPLIANDHVVPQWLDGGDRFWYRNKTGNGAEFVVVDPRQGTKGLFFDHTRLAAAMSLAADTSFDAGRFPFQTFELNDAETSIAFNAHDKGFTCDIRSYQCVLGDTIPSMTGFVRSPDGTMEAFVHEFDLWVRPHGGGDSTQLTRDGEEYWRYGDSYPRPSTIINKVTSRPVLQWSPDSRKIAVQRLDERNVEKMVLYSSTHQRPQHYLYPYSLPGDTVLSRFDVHVVDVSGNSNVRVQMDPQPYLTFSATGLRDSTWLTVKWKQNGQRLYFTHATRGAKRIQLMEVDLNTGAAR